MSCKWVGGVFVALLLSGCSGQDDDLREVVGFPGGSGQAVYPVGYKPPVAPSGPGEMVLVAHGPTLEYSYMMNDEPICWHVGGGILTFSGYPLRSGTNSGVLRVTTIPATNLPAHRFLDATLVRAGEAISTWSLPEEADADEEIPLNFELP